MTESWFNFELPSELIAQYPAAKRDESRLLVCNRTGGTIQHHLFRDILNILSPGDLLVVNNTKVIPARLVGHRETTGGKWEGLFLQTTPDGLWQMMTQTRGRPEAGENIVIIPGQFSVRLIRREDQFWLVEPNLAGNPVELLTQFGHVPLPPYIRKGVDEASDHERYQTVYAEHAGSVAAPTAGLHFTTELLSDLEAKGVRTATVTLHVGAGTFAPIKTEDPTQHQMHHEWGEVSSATVDLIRETKGSGKRVVAVGTTATRALESAARDGDLKPWTGETNIYIYPPYQFKVIDGLITNFHLPKTTLLLLVASLSGKELLGRAYQEAIQQRYRFFSYGDAMLII